MTYLYVLNTSYHDVYIYVHTILNTLKCSQLLHLLVCVIITRHPKFCLPTYIRIQFICTRPPIFVSIFVFNLQSVCEF